VQVGAESREYEDAVWQLSFTNYKLENWFLHETITADH
jgi:hypothetical protein